MTVQISPDLAASMLAGVTIPAMFNGGELRVYTGDVPFDLTAPTGTLLASVKGPGATPLHYTINANSVELDPDIAWILETVAAGVPGYIIAVGNAGFANCRAASDLINIPTFTSAAAQLAVTTLNFSIFGQG